MYRLSEQLLAILITLLLVLSPLQGALAGFAISSNQGGNAHQMAIGHDGGTFLDAGHVACQDCEQCSTEDGCNGHSCPSSQCTSCTLAAFPIFAYFTNPTVMLGLAIADDTIISQFSPSLFLFSWA